jgi:hypothetical protein
MVYLVVVCKLGACLTFSCCLWPGISTGGNFSCHLALLINNNQRSDNHTSTMSSPRGEEESNRLRRRDVLDIFVPTAKQFDDHWPMLKKMIEWTTYQCGDLFYPETRNAMGQVFLQKAFLKCTMSVEKEYYYVQGRNFKTKDICWHCLLDSALLSHEELKQLGKSGGHKNQTHTNINKHTQTNAHTSKCVSGWLLLRAFLCGAIVASMNICAFFFSPKTIFCFSFNLHLRFYRTVPMGNDSRYCGVPVLQLFSLFICLYCSFAVLLFLIVHMHSFHASHMFRADHDRKGNVYVNYFIDPKDLVDYLPFFGILMFFLFHSMLRR